MNRTREPGEAKIIYFKVPSDLIQINYLLMKTAQKYIYFSFL
jgi:hypothetical protein